MDRSFGWNMQQQHSNSGLSTVQNAKLRYESARSFDIEEDLEFNPCLTNEELNAAYAESSLSSRSGRSDAGSPPQQPSMPLPLNPYNQQHQQMQNSQNSNNARYGSRKNRGNNAVPIVNPNYSAHQWR